MGRTTDKIIISFAKKVRENFYPSKIIMFGSRATGKAKKHSDYDFLLISPKFRKMEWEERSSKVYFLKKDISAAMDIICLTPEEFEQRKKEIGVIQEADRSGVII